MKRMWKVGGTISGVSFNLSLSTFNGYNPDLLNSFENDTSKLMTVNIYDKYTIGGVFKSLNPFFNYTNLNHKGKLVATSFREMRKEIKGMQSKLLTLMMLKMGVPSDEKI